MNKVTSMIAIASTVLITACTTQAEQTDSGAEFQTASSASSVEQVKVAERFLSGGLLQMGNANAPVSMLLFVNHSSEYSQQFNQNILPRLLVDFVQQGTLQIGIVPMQFKKYPESQMTAAMLLCATMQGKGRAMNDLLFAKPNESEIQKQIGAMGLDLTQMKTCLESDTLKQQMDSEAKLIQSFGITTAPSYTLNGQVYKGLPEYADMRGQIQAALTR